MEYIIIGTVLLMMYFNWKKEITHNGLLTLKQATGYDCGIIAYIMMGP